MKKTMFIVIAVLATMLMILPAFAFVNVDTETFDTNWEMFGPHIDRIFVKMYAGVDKVYIALKGGLVDVLDWPGTKTDIDSIKDDPAIATLYYPSPPSERGYFEVCINENNETTLGPPGPTDPNLKKPNPTADVDFRNASAWLINRTYLDNDVTEGYAVRMVTEMVPYMIGWIHTDIEGHPEWRHGYDAVVANATLEKGGFPTDKSTGWRWPDFNEDGIHQAGEKWDPENDELDFYVRLDRFRKMAGEHLVDGLKKAGVPVKITYVTGGQAYEICMINKDFHAYTAGWIFMGPEPDYLFDLHHPDEYYHDPENAPPNYQRCNDSVLNPYLEGIKYGATLHGPLFNYPTYPSNQLPPQPDTIYVNSSAWRAQERMCYYVHDIPLFATLGVKGMSKTYTDPGKPYTGAKWKDAQNEQGFGLNSYFTFLNAYPEGYIYGTGVPGQEMMMQYGWKETVYPQHLNILYAEWYWDFEVLGKIYEALTVRNPYLPAQYVPWYCNYYEKGTYTYKGVTCAKVLISLKTGITFSDGEPLTANDVAFSLVEVTKLLLDRKFSPPWWYTSTAHILSYTIIDPLTIEVLCDSNSAWATLWTMLAPPIIPEHKWRTLVTSGDPTGYKPETTMTGSGPFKFRNETTGVTLEMEANKNFGRYLPIMNELNVTWVDYTTTSYPKMRADPGYPQTWAIVEKDIRIWNRWLNGCYPGSYLIVDIYKYVDGKLEAGYPKTDIKIYRNDYYLIHETENLTKCKHEIKVAVHIKGPPNIQETPPIANPWICQWKNDTFPIWVTIKYDIAGAKYLDKVVAPDCKVEGKDNAFVAAAYNTVPGDPRWKANADVTGDYKVEGKDVAWIAKFYGKW